MTTILDGSGEVITDGSGFSIYDGESFLIVDRFAETSDLDPFIQRIQEDIPDAPDIVINPHLKRIIREFTEKSWVLYQGIQVQGSDVLDSINQSIAWDMEDYVSDLEPFDIKSLKDTSREYKTQEKVLLTEIEETRLKINGVKFFEVFKAETGDEMTSIRIFPFSEDDPLLSMMVAFKTLKDATEVPVVLVDDWLEPICCGVMARMMRQPGRPWTEPNLWQTNHGIYKSGISKAKLKWFQNNSRAYAVGKRYF